MHSEDFWCLQVFLLLIAFLAVPWMLIPKPYILKKRHEARIAQVVLWHVHVCCCASGSMSLLH